MHDEPLDKELVQFPTAPLAGGDDASQGDGSSMGVHVVAPARDLYPAAQMFGSGVAWVGHDVPLGHT